MPAPVYPWMPEDPDDILAEILGLDPMGAVTPVVNTAATTAGYRNPWDAVSELATDPAWMEQVYRPADAPYTRVRDRDRTRPSVRFGDGRDRGRGWDGGTSPGPSHRPGGWGSSPKERKKAARLGL